METEIQGPKTPYECTALYNKMLEFAIKAHGTQPYDKGAPYVVHLIGVSNILNKYGFHVDDVEFGVYVHVVSLGHDLMEDTKEKYKTLLPVFGEAITEAIYVLSDEKGRDRDEKNRKTWPHIKKNKIALPVKLADRITNMEVSVANKSHQLKRYVNEYMQFRKTLYTKTYESMWTRLDELYRSGHQILQEDKAIWADR